MLDIIYEEGICGCGCGETITIKPHHKYTGIPIFKHNHVHRIKGINSGQFKKGQPSRFKGLTLSEKTRKKISESQKDRFKKNKQLIENIKKRQIGTKGEETNAWKGGCDRWYHHESQKLFNKGKCEICGMSNYKHKKLTGRKLSMHCRNKNYSDLSEVNWVTVCQFGCHQKLERFDLWR